MTEEEVIKALKTVELNCPEKSYCGYSLGQAIAAVWNAQEWEDTIFVFDTYAEDLLRWIWEDQLESKISWRDFFETYLDPLRTITDIAERSGVIVDLSFHGSQKDAALVYTAESAAEVEWLADCIRQIESGEDWTSYPPVFSQEAKQILETVLRAVLDIPADEDVEWEAFGGYEGALGVLKNITARSAAHLSR